MVVIVQIVVGQQQQVRPNEADAILPRDWEENVYDDNWLPLFLHIIIVTHFTKRIIWLERENNYLQLTCSNLLLKQFIIMN